MVWSLLHKECYIAFLNLGLQLSDAQFAAWYDLQKFKRRMWNLLESQEQAAKQGLSYVHFSTCNYISCNLTQARKVK